MELKYDKQIKEIEKIIERRNYYIEVITNGDNSEQAKTKFIWFLNKQIDEEQMKIGELKELQKPIEVDLIL